MTEQELDDFFIETLNKILIETKDCADYVKNETSDEYKEIQEEYSYAIEDLTNLLKNIKTIDDLAEQDEDEITAVFEYLASYLDNYIISQEPEQRQKDLEECAKLDELLNLFYDEEDEE